MYSDALLLMLQNGNGTLNYNIVTVKVFFCGFMRISDVLPLKLRGFSP